MDEGVLAYAGPLWLLVCALVWKLGWKFIPDPEAPEDDYEIVFTPDWDDDE